jgi:hypothetical protein
MASWVASSTVSVGEERVFRDIRFVQMLRL